MTMALILITYSFSNDIIGGLAVYVALRVSGWAAMGDEDEEGDVGSAKPGVDSEHRSPSGALPFSPSPSLSLHLSLHPQDLGTPSSGSCSPTSLYLLASLSLFPPPPQTLTGWPYLPIFLSLSLTATPVHLPSQGEVVAAATTSFPSHNRRSRAGGASSLPFRQQYPCELLRLVAALPSSGR